MDEKDLLEEIKSELSIEQIQELLIHLEGNPILKNENLIISKTICHCGNSHKLFYYDNTKLFRCYTECDTTFDIFELIIKIKNKEGLKITLPEAINFILNFFHLENRFNKFKKGFESNIQDWEILNRYKKNKENKKQIVEMKYYDDKFLSYLPKPHILNWEQEGIKKEVLDKYGICYNGGSQGIVIPHYDKDNHLVGVRERTLIKENEEFGKYRPMILNRQMYNHPLGFNLYNLNNSKYNIAAMKQAIIFEGEKSCLKYASLFGIENDISVACCGSSISSYQMDLLLKLGIKEVIIAFDKQFQNLGDEECQGWTNKLIQIHNKYSSLVKISFMFDKNNLLGYKDSPIDKTMQIFIQLFKERVRL